MRDQHRVQGEETPQHPPRLTRRRKSEPPPQPPALGAVTQGLAYVQETGGARNVLHRASLFQAQSQNKPLPMELYKAEVPGIWTHPCNFPRNPPFFIH